ncbi:MAG TPA: hypothetical protein VGE11_25525 [Pseudonocardia sp.]
MNAPLPGPPPPGTAHQPVDTAVRVDEAMAGLEGLQGRPLAEHVAAYERVHAALGEALAAGDG